MYTMDENSGADIYSAYGDIQEEVENLTIDESSTQQSVDKSGISITVDRKGNFINNINYGRPPRPPSPIATAASTNQVPACWMYPPPEYLNSKVSLAEV